MATPLTPNQVVAANLRRARELRGLTQDEASAAIAPFLGERWSKALFSNAERSVDGKRIRPFDADELVAFSRAFHLPVTWFLLPPAALDEVGTGTADPLRAHQLIDLLFEVGSDYAGVEQVPARLGELFAALPAHERTTTQRLAEQHARAVSNAVITEQLGGADALIDALRNLADAVEDSTIKVGVELLADNAGANE